MKAAMTPENFDMIYLKRLPWEIMELIWYYLPIETKIKTRKTYYERYHYLLFQKIRRVDDFMFIVIKNKYNYLFKLILTDYYIKWSEPIANYNILSIFDSYLIKLIFMCDTTKNNDFKTYILRFKREKAENKLKEREKYKDYSYLHNIRNIWREQEIIQKN